MYKLTYKIDGISATVCRSDPKDLRVLIEKNQVVLKNDDYAIYLDIEEGTLFLEDMVVTVSKSHDKKSVFVFSTKIANLTILNTSYFIFHIFTN